MKDLGITKYGMQIAVKSNFIPQSHEYFYINIEIFHLLTVKHCPWRVSLYL